MNLHLQRLDHERFTFATLDGLDKWHFEDNLLLFAKLELSQYCVRQVAKDFVVLLPVGTATASWTGKVGAESWALGSVCWVDPRLTCPRRGRCPTNTYCNL